MTSQDPPPSPFTLRYLHEDGKLRRGFDVSELGNDSWGRWVLRDASTPVEFDDGEVGRFPHAAVTLIPDMTTSWWTLVAPVVDGNCEVTKLYGNVGRPAALIPASGRFDVIDLELDIVWTDDRFAIVDVEEFEAVDMTAECATRASETAEELLGLLAERGKALAEAATWYVSSQSSQGAHRELSRSISRFLGLDDPAPADSLVFLGVDSLSLSALAAQFSRGGEREQSDVETTLWRAESMAGVWLAFARMGK